MNITHSGLITLLAATALALLPGNAFAAKQSVDGYTIHYNALSANLLPEKVTDQLKLERSLRQGVVNVTVLDENGNTAPAKVQGSARTLTGQPVTILFQAVGEAGNKSWIGSFDVPASGTLRFALDVTPAGAKTQHLQFVHDYILD